MLPDVASKQGMTRDVLRDMRGIFDSMDMSHHGVVDRRCPPEHALPMLTSPDECVEDEVSHSGGSLQPRTRHDAMVTVNDESSGRLRARAASPLRVCLQGAGDPVS